MTLFCPGCNTAIDGAAAAGLREMNCPQCGTRFSVPEPDLADAAHWGEVTTSRLAIISLIAGIGSLVLPLCLCPFMLLGFSRAVGPTATSVGGPVRPMLVTTMTITTATASPSPLGPPPDPPPDPVKPPPVGGDDQSGGDGTDGGGD